MEWKLFTTVTSRLTLLFWESFRRSPMYSYVFRGSRADHPGKAKRTSERKICRGLRRNILTKKLRCKSFPILNCYNDWSNYDEIKRTPPKNVILWLVLVFLFFNFVGAASTQHPDTSEVKRFFSENVLTSSACPLESQMRSDICPRESNNLQIRVNFCGFANRCPGKEPVCIETDDGPVYICSPRNLRCQAGFRRIARVDERTKDKVHIYEERCPPNTFQPVQSMCFDACKYLHPAHVPDQFLEYFPGDNVSPAKLYCDYNNGYYNDQGQFLINATDAQKNQWKFCTHVNMSDPCVDRLGHITLPNSTCSLACSMNEYRDDFDNFVCKPKFSTATSGKFYEKQESVQKEVAMEKANLTSTPSTATNMDESVRNVTKDGATTVKGSEATDDNAESEDRDNTWIGPLAGAVGLELVALIVVFIIVGWKKISRFVNSSDTVIHIRGQANIHIHASSDSTSQDTESSELDDGNTAMTQRKRTFREDAIGTEMTTASPGQRTEVRIDIQSLSIMEIANELGPSRLGKTERLKENGEDTDAVGEELPFLQAS